MTRETERSFRRHGAPAVNDLVKAGRRDAQCDRKCMRAQAAGLQIIFVQNFARMNGWQLWVDLLRYDILAARRRCGYLRDMKFFYRASACPPF